MAAETIDKITLVSTSLRDNSFFFMDVAL